MQTTIIAAAKLTLPKTKNPEKIVDIMNEKLKTITNSLIPETSSIKDIATAKMFSELCEDTCSNLFAFSPYQLQIEKDTFLRFQYLADELKNYIEEEDCSFDSIKAVCSKLNIIYKELMICCWNAFIYDTDINSEPGKFIVSQLATVSDYEKKLLSTKI